MDLPNLKELKAILKLCRAQGVNKITLAEMIIEFGEMPKTKEELEADGSEDSAGIAAPTDEELAYWSAAPDPLAMREGAEQ